MECERCGSGAEAIFRVRTDILDMLVCVACAKEARIIGIPVESAIDRNDRQPPVIRDNEGKARLLPRNAHY